MKDKLFGKTLAELRAVADESGMPRHSAGQMAAWLYKKGAREIATMTDISAAHRAALAQRFEMGLSEPLRETVSTDGTKKHLFAVDAPGGNAHGDLRERSLNRPCGAHYPDHENLFVEAAMIPDAGRNRDTQRATLCLSSQVGCRMGCAFCATGRMGLAQNLTAGEILNQFASLPGRNAGGDSIFGPQWLTNIVYMGMGEPLDNLDEVLRSIEILTAPWGYGWSPTRVTLSTAGITPALERFLGASRVHLAVSLHNPFSDERAQIMPVERAYPIAGIVAALKRYPFEAQRRVSFEYIVMSGLNDSPRHIAGLTKLLGGLSCRVNLIRFHKVPGSPFFSPPVDAMERFRDALTRKGIRTTIRASRGEDIDAACGLLSTKTR